MCGIIVVQRSSALPQSRSAQDEAADSYLSLDRSPGPGFPPISRFFEFATQPSAASCLLLVLQPSEPGSAVVRHGALLPQSLAGFVNAPGHGMLRLKLHDIAIKGSVRSSTGESMQA